MVHKSLEFVKQRIASGECGDMKNNNYSNMKEVCFTDIVEKIVCDADMVINQSRNEWKLKSYVQSENGDMKEINVEIKYNPDADFDYFTTERRICDGTLIFYFELCNKILKNVFFGSTYYKPKLPYNYENEMEKYVIKYTVGNFIFAEELGEKFAVKDKPWMMSRFSVMLPIKCDFIKK